jgi:hypothetical protein
MRIDPSGNLNYGTTGSSTYALRQVYMPTNGGTAILGSAAYHTTNAYFDGAWKATATGGSAQYLQANNVHTWSNAASVAANAAVTWAESMRIDASGNVGIGTSSPTSKLHVVGGRTDLAANSEPYSLGVRYNSGTGQYYIGATNSATPDMVFSRSGGVEVMRLTDSGNLGIGLTNPASKLAVDGNPPTAGALAAVSAAAGISLALSDNINCSLYVRHPASGPVIGTDGGNALRFATNGNAASDEKMRIDSSGNVGIGTSSPSEKLVVGGSSGPSSSPTAIQMDSTYHLNSPAFDKLKFYLFKSSTESFGFGLGNLSDIQYWAGASSTGNHIWYTSQTERARIDSSGNLLVGLTSGAKLSVSYGGNDTHFGLGANYDNYITAGSSGATCAIDLCEVRLEC